MVYDMRRSVAFYRDVLGFEVEASWEPDGHYYWAQLRSGDTRLMLNAEFEDEERPPEPNRPHGKDVTFCFYPAYVAALRESLVAQGQKPGALQGTQYQHRQFELRDPDGYKLMFTQPVQASE
ncbi:MAG: hypothetical protein RIS54_593 [Verrucomicrobiota bacterium]|jgi:uncharacterized glyoxalase superfamily protein PhnB